MGDQKRKLLKKGVLFFFYLFLLHSQLFTGKNEFKSHFQYQNLKIRKMEVGSFILK